MNFAILGISGKAHSGKTTSYDTVKNIIATKYPGYRIVYLPFAAKLKEIAKDVFGWDGDKEIYMVPMPVEGVPDVHVMKPQPDKGRQLLINIGALMREIRPTVWCDYVCNEIKKTIQEDWDTTPVFSQNIIFVIDDIRYKNEMESLKKFGNKFLSVRLNRKSQLYLNTKSELDLDDYEGFDYSIDNNGSKLELDELLDTIVEDLVSRSKGRVHAKG